MGDVLNGLWLAVLVLYVSCVSPAFSRLVWFAVVAVMLGHLPGT